MSTPDLETTAAERARWLPAGEVTPDVAAVLRDLDRALAEIDRLNARDSLGPYKLIHPDHLAGLDARIAELEAANTVCRRDIAALMRSADSLEARNTELEADYARAEDITKRAHAVSKKAMERIAELEAEVALQRVSYQRCIAELVAERDRLKRIVDRITQPGLIEDRIIFGRFETVGFEADAIRSALAASSGE
jgi:cell division protein FtsB